MAELHSENLTKSTENHRLVRNVKKVTQELSDLKKEKLRLERDLEEAHQERSKHTRTIHVSASCFPDMMGGTSRLGPVLVSVHRKVDVVQKTEEFLKNLRVFLISLVETPQLDTATHPPLTVAIKLTIVCVLLFHALLTPAMLECELFLVSVYLVIWLHFS